jgi:hypothetical protein
MLFDDLIGGNDLADCVENGIDFFDLVPADAVVDGDDLQLCRLKDTGHPALWGFALFTYINERYEVNVLPTGLPFGSPEPLDCATGLYLGNPPA